MNVVVDQGNTSTKIALFDEGKLHVSFVFNLFNINDLDNLLSKYSPLKGILSSVIGVDPEVMSLMRKKMTQVVLLDEHTPLPIQLQYRTPETLGKDRIAAVMGARSISPERNALVIDAGTAITYDLMESGKIYVGGNISPGMTIRFKALNEYTKRLPLLDENGDIPDMGYDTQTAIRAGVVGGICKEMDAYIDEFRLKYPDLLVFLTGGHSFYFETKLKNSIFADGNLVQLGLNEILNYQYA